MMKFHPLKCHVLPVSRKRLPHLNKRFPYKLNNVTLEYCSIEKDLGVYVTSKLNFTDHCNKLYSKANSRLWLSKRSCHFLKNRAQKRKIYLAMVRSLFEHCSVVWRPSNQTTKNKLESLQKRSIKWILSEEYHSYTNLDYLLRCRQLDILPLDFKFTFNDLLLFHKILNNFCPIKLPNYLHHYDPGGRRRLRSCHLDHLSLVSDVQPKVYAKYSKNSVDGAEFKTFDNSFFYRSHLAWNNLPLDVREITIHSLFRSRLRAHLWKEALELTLSEFRDQNMPLTFSLPRILPSSNIIY